MHSEESSITPGNETIVQSPGRVNLLGEHVDYNDGIVLPAAIDRHVELRAVPREDGIVNIQSANMKKAVSFSLRDLEARVDLDGQSLPNWAIYPAGVAWAMQKSGFSASGLDGVIRSDLPIGAGLSSSAAVELAFAVYWQQAGEWRIDRMNLAKLCQQAENEYVGVNCGLMDQFACAHGVARHALYLDIQNEMWQPIPMPLHTSIVIADSSIKRKLTESRYNERREECAEALRLIQHSFPDKKSLRDVSMRELQDAADDLPDNVYKRARHVIEEIECVKQGSERLFNDDSAGFGQLMVQSHISLRDLYEVSIPELDALVEIAISTAGCYGARLTGAGFGGCTVNLVEKAQAETFAAKLAKAYTKRTGLQANVHICQPSRGTHIRAEE